MGGADPDTQLNNDQLQPTDSPTQQKKNLVSRWKVDTWNCKTKECLLFFSLWTFDLGPVVVCSEDETKTPIITVNVPYQQVYQRLWMLVRPFPHEAVMNNTSNLSNLKRKCGSGGRFYFSSVYSITSLHHLYD